MSASVLVRSPSSVVEHRRTTTVRRALCRPSIAALVLVGVYVLLVLLCDPGGQLGGDTGARVATLRSMAQGNWPHPDVGYWAAQYDPTGRLHPMWLAEHLGAHWLTVGTVPTLIIGYPLFQLGGYRALLVLPMAGAVLAAFAARRLARSLGSRSDGWVAFWVIGLASPLTVYALDFWDHALGLGLMLWGIAALVDLVDRDSSTAGERWPAVRRGAVAGLCFGLAAIVRTEAFVYAAVTVAVIGGVLLARRRFAAVLTAGVAMLTAAMACLLGNAVLERWALGTTLRSARATDTLQTAADLGLGGRVKIAFLSGMALRPGLGSLVYGEGLLFVGTVGAAAWLAHRGDRRRAGMALVLAAAILTVRMASGLSFIPGLLAATPLAIAGLVLGWRLRGGPALLAVAVGGFAGVVATQFPMVTVNGFTWAGRYVLVSGALAVVVGVTALEGLGRRVVTAGVAMALVVTGFGVTMLVVRTRNTAAWTEAITARTEAVVISRVPEAFRDAGAGYTLDARWLAAADADELHAAFDVAGAVDAPTVALVSQTGATVLTIDGWCRGESEVVPWETAGALRITHYDRASSGTACPAADPVQVP
jgi:hypothetical protein